MGRRVFLLVLRPVIGVSNPTSRGDITHTVGTGGTCAAWDSGGGLMMAHYVAIADVPVDLFVVIPAPSLWRRRLGQKRTVYTNSLVFKYGGGI